MEKYLHIICLNVPYPVDYGGVFDLFYKLPALQKQGVKIYLHCFEYGRGEQPELNKYCEAVYYYPRAQGLRGVSLRYPYIVSSRYNEALTERLSQDDYAILMEGVHCTYLLNDSRFDQRRCFVRLHNVEHIYYNHLSKNAQSPFKKIYFSFESKLLKAYEKFIAGKATFWSVIEKDAITYKELGCNNISFLPLFLPPWQVRTTFGKGNFCLYQGDLSVNENDKAAIWLIEEVFADLNIAFVIAGKNPSSRLTELVRTRNNTCLVASPKEAEMQDLIDKAHINIIPSFNSTGIKLKLINALYNGRHCLVNYQTIEGTGLEEVCFLANDAASFKTAIKELYEQPFEEKDIKLRKQLLDNIFDNTKNAKQVVKWIWEE